MSDEHVPVLIVGGGLAGLTTALFLGLHGVRPLVVEKHPGTSVIMKARGQYPHTMEALRIGGIADRIAAAGPDAGTGEFYMVVADSLAGPVLKRIMTEGEMAMRHVSPENWAMAGQERTEVILADRAAELGAELRFDTELVSLTQSADAVTAVLRDVRTGTERTVTADHVVGADGAHSAVRRKLGIAMHGRGNLGEIFRVFFDADLSGPLRQLPGVAEGRKFALFWLQQPVPGVFYTTDVPGRYGYVLGMSRNPPDFAAFTEERCVELVRTGLGLPDLAMKVVETGRTDIVSEIADRFSEGRVHLVGDAARLVPAPGGLGGNTAITDGFYLAWKLAMVVKGEAGPGLLDSHDAERRPVSEMIGEQQLRNTVERLAGYLDDGALADPLPPVVQAFGYRCANGAVVREPDDAGELLEDPAAPTGRPGSRAPYVVLPEGSPAASTTALFGRSFVLLTGEGTGDAWTAAAAGAAGRLGITLPVHRLAGAEWEKSYGVTGAGAVLVRPDRFVAWRSKGPAADADAARKALESALRTVLDRPGPVL
ncbi:FAD-dependent monooxygenase [Streptomyces pilosus]|uniref:FAD-dependent oxidoreductase n=1 Tax=Streptomyces pilosus TaxID=28893 RepID=A0A918F5J1_9ACTN|nr:FAD-dependent monooxygenase [Streptomyces pilosus]GGR06557.1 FAD-dependent oxidoreductase [Streptomyces pilosus]